MPAVPLPSVTSDQRIAAQRYLASQGILRDLHNKVKRPVIATKCPTLDWATGIGGWPRGRIIEMYGPEASGKCSKSDTLIPVPGQGILTLEEMANLAVWADGSKSKGSRTPDKCAPLMMDVVNAYGTTQTTHVYFPGLIDTTILYTQQGHSLQGSSTHRILTMTDVGLLNWIVLPNARPGQVVFSLLNTKVTHYGKPFFIEANVEPDFIGPREVRTKEYAALLGALVTAESRLDALHIMTACASQRRNVKDWSTTIGIEQPYEVNPKWVKFTGLAKLSKEMESLCRIATHPTTIKSLRTSSQMLQRAWASGVSLTRGLWTHEHLEIEIESEEIARVFQAICENVGVRWTRYSTLNTFGDRRWKLTLRSRSDQQRAEKVLWNDFPIPPTWRKFMSPEEDENPPLVKKTIELAVDVLKEAGLSIVEFDLEDTSKEVCKRLADIIAPLPIKSKKISRLVDTLYILADERVTFDYVSGTQAGGKAECYDLSVPIGQHYSANGVISHNSTIALHSAKQELESRKDSIVAYFDYERAVPEEYVEAMGLLEYSDRFFLLDPNSIEEGNKILVGMYQNKFAPSLVVVDSVAAATPQDLFGRDMEDAAPVAIRARKWSEVMDTWSKFGGDYGTTFMLLNQVRTKIVTDLRNKPKQIVGAMGAELEQTPGGLAIKFYASQRVRLEPMKVIVANIFNPATGEEEAVPVANLVKAFFIKNKLAPPFRKGTFFIEFGKGIDVVRTMVEIATIRNFIQTSEQRGYLSLKLQSGREILGKGEPGLVEELKKDQSAQNELYKMLEWDHADQVANQVRSYTTVVPGGEKNTTAVVGAEDGLIEYIARMKITLSMINQAPTAAEKGLLLNLIEKAGRAFVYKTSGGAEIRAANMQSMEDKIKGSARDELLVKIQSAVNFLEEIKQQEEAPIPVVDQPGQTIVLNDQAEETPQIPNN